MPQKTFNNLSHERQREIINVSLEEFSMNDYESASLTDIIKRLGIAKGSFYRYFESKEELYNYLQNFSRDLLKLITVQMLNSPEKEFITLWQDLLLDFKTKEEKYPMIIRFWMKAMKSRAFSFEENNEILRQKLEMMNGSLSGRREKDSLRENPDFDYIIHGSHVSPDGAD